MKLILIGFGAVGQGLAEILRDKEADLRRRHGFEAEIIGVVTASKGCLHHAGGLKLGELLAAAENGSFADYPDDAGLRRDWDARAMIAHGGADALVEASPTDLETGGPALDYCHMALEHGLHIALANKGPVALDYVNLRAKADGAGLSMRYEATVMAGTPIMQMAEDGLAGCAIRSARGILNGTTNFILTRMESGVSYSGALTEAQALGYAESDPSGDVDGWDAAAKALILANVLFGSRMTMDDIDVRGISGISLADIEAARADGQRYKLIAEADEDGGRVAPLRLSVDDPLASVSGANNAITLETDLLGDVTLIGAGAGKMETGAAILSDLLAIARGAEG